MSFTGFPRQTLAFLKAIDANNSKDWFEAHRDEYRDYYMAPALALIEALAPVAENLDPPHKAEARLRVWVDTAGWIVLLLAVLALAAWQLWGKGT